MAGARNKDLDRLRAVAIFLVLVSHIPLLFPWRLGKPPGFLAYLNFWTGVDLFFAISGFIVSRLLIDDLDPALASGRLSVAIKSFFLRRVFRLIPLAWGWVLIAALLSVLFSESNVLPTPAAIASEFVAIGLNVYNLADAFDWSLMNSNGYKRLGPYWSLSMEEQFYLCMPILLIVLRSSRSRVIFLATSLVGVVFVIRPALVAADVSANFILKFTLTRMDALLCGCLLCFFSRTALYVRVEPRALRYRPFGAIVFGCLCFAVAYVPTLIGPNLDTVRLTIAWPALDIACALLVWIASYDRNYLAIRPVEPIVEWLGSRSYSIYLAHWPALWMAQETGYRTARALAVPMNALGPLYLSMFILLTCSLAELAHRLVERPLNRKGHRFAKALEAG